ncbi:FxLD family lanthipeptide [Glycomyces salinus]|uniref:FxLD family lanthipeptide n=1 Tax=Glycomyces salinus TaxID=980294 RepID=UPI0018EDD8EE|nr:FxLD family lanthipeptide [Glycomyces salinus]
MESTTIETPDVSVEEFDLDISFVEGDQYATLMEATSDNCTSTRASACVTCT